MEDVEAYQNAMDYLNSFVDYSMVSKEVMAAAKFELGRVFDLMEALGNPQQKYPVIHVAGSKGKGSVSALCTAALQAQGYKVGLYISPHLIEFEERIQINRKNILKRDLVQLINDVKPYVSPIPGLTTFEILTALAFWHFAREEVDVAVIEVGMGGRLDPSNVVVPSVSVITTIYLEHTYILGDTLAKIAGEKAGIIKQNVPVVTAPQSTEAMEVFIRTAHEKNAPLVQVGKEYSFAHGTANLDGQTFSVFSSRDQQKDELKIMLLGAYQVENAATAYAALRTLNDQGVVVTRDAIRKGFAAANWPGRFEVMHKIPPVIIDAAHTPDAVQKLYATIDEFFPGQPIVLIFGVSEDKDVRKMFAEILPLSNKVVFTQSSHPRAMDVKRMADEASDYELDKFLISDPKEALVKALSLTKDEGVVIVTGSIFTAAAVRESWFEIKDTVS